MSNKAGILVGRRGRARLFESRRARQVFTLVQNLSHAQGRLKYQELKSD